MPDDAIYDLECTKGHRFSVDATELEDYIDDNGFHCKKCKSPVDLCDEVSLECHICSETYSANSLKEARDAEGTQCGHCSGLGFRSYFLVPDSWPCRLAEYDWTYNPTNPEQLQRLGRDDYWEGVIHFCTQKEFISIYDDQKIKASGTGYFRVPAVCLTETPKPCSSGLQKVHGDHGFVFKKSRIIAAGGNPAIYMGPKLIARQTRAGGFAVSVRPFVNLLRLSSVHSGSHYDFLHEREWRVPGDIDLRAVKPFAVIIPGDTVHQRFVGNHRETLLAAAMQFGEL